MKFYRNDKGVKTLFFFFFVEKKAYKVAWSQCNCLNLPKVTLYILRLHSIFINISYINNCLIINISVTISYNMSCNLKINFM